MANSKLDASIARDADGSPSVEAVREKLMKVGAALMEKAAGNGTLENVAAIYRDDPLKAKVLLQKRALRHSPQNPDRRVHCA